MSHPILFSGIQPSGSLIVGNYFGAIKPWLGMQGSHQCFFCIVDLHAITVRQDPEALRKQTLDTLALYLSSGLDPEKSTLFIQSHVPQHSELTWILNCYAQMGELNRMTQFKDKAGQHSQNINVGLFDYPVLMAADILLYGTERVPVGQDQKQHLELARDIATRFNHYHGDVFTVPEPVIAKHGAKIMSLQDPLKKMSKSDPSEGASIRMLDVRKAIVKKIKRSVTDSDTLIAYDPETKPGVANLLTLMALSTDKSIEDCVNELSGLGYGALKEATGNAVADLLEPIQAKFEALRQDEDTLMDIVRQGAKQAQAQCAPMLAKVQDAIGLIEK